MDIQQLIDDANKQYHAALTMNDIGLAQHYAQQVNALQLELNKQNVNKMWVTSKHIDPNKVFIQSNPYNIVYTDSMDAVTWLQGDTEAESDTSFQARKELDRRRNLRLFIHHARLFCEKFPNWTMGPDPSDPFNKIEVKHKNGKYRIESNYPDNEVKLIGVDKDQNREDENFRRRKGIPHGIYNMKPETVPTYTFFGWSIGMDDVPEWAKE